MLLPLRHSFISILWISVFAALTTAYPSPSIGARSLQKRAICANAPSVVAGTLYNPPPSSSSSSTPPHRLRQSAPEPLPHIPNPKKRSSSNSAFHCVPHSTVYITLTLTSLLPGRLIPFLLSEVIGIIDDALEWHGDGPVGPGGLLPPNHPVALPNPGANNMFAWPALGAHPGISVAAWNSPGAQLTWTVLQAAVRGVFDYMMEEEWGEALFTVYEGGREVGMGRIG